MFCNKNIELLTRKYLLGNCKALRGLSDYPRKEIIDCVDENWDKANDDVDWKVQVH